ncbi:DUF5129 domain-containing protein [Micrococcus porci]|uniref:DUF5129 domain-containing protein n=1 Tax=Micrococcus porci TaxID=2856555 RepID=UPI001CC95B70|nr:DUF5129 domain-containing protein [Micrococcus porci]UBH24633.1 DUF5129 domain-containing protein [Micrococcus porci]
MPEPTAPRPSRLARAPRARLLARAARPLAAAAVAGAALAGAAAPAGVAATAAAVPVAAGAVVAAPAAHALEWSRVDLADQAGIIDPAQLERDLAGIEFRAPTRVAVFTERGPDIRGLDEERKAQAFNGRVLEFARAQRPGWISADGQKWADGLVIVAVDPDNRMLGVYQGEDRKLESGGQSAVREAGTDAARDARWTDAVVDMVDEAATRIGRPWNEDPVVWLGLGGGALGVLGAGAGITAAVVGPRRSRARRSAEHLEEARHHLTSVTLDWETTELNASTVPLGSRHGARLMERYRGFHRSALDATARLEELEAAPVKDRSAQSFVDRAGGVRDDVAALDALDDAIADANALLNRLPGWEDAWDRQVAPLREDLHRVPALHDRLGDVDGTAVPLAALDSFRDEARTELERLGTGLTAQTVAPDDAIDALERLRRRLTVRIEELARAVAQAQDGRKKQRLMQESLDGQRAVPRDRRGSILDAGDGWRTYWTVTAFDAGVDAGDSAVASYESSSSGTGYGSSGGSFSGSGSSGSF